MKKSFLLFSASLLLAGSIGGGKILATSANEPTVGEEIQALLADYLNADGYTKKTTIGLNAAAVEEMSACFHCNETAKKRTTYYRPGQLLLAAEDGSIPEGSGSYVYDANDHEVKRAAALGNSTNKNMWTNLSEPVSVGQNNANGLEDYYITLATFMSSGYFDGWGKNGNVYYYDLTNEDKVKDNETHIYNCDIWNEFLYFCAPMLYKNSGYYLSAKSLTITKKYDADSNGYLCLDMYLENIDSGKLDCDYLAEARIYENNYIFEEDLSESYFLRNGPFTEGKFVVDNDSGTKQLKLMNVPLLKGNAVKVWSSKSEYHGVSQGYAHNLTSTAGMVDGEDNYIIPEDGNYDFYIKLNDDGSFKDVYVNDKSAKTYYVSLGWSDIDGSKLWARYYNGSNEITSDESKPGMIYSHQNEYNQAVYKVTIPGEANKIQFCYNKTGGGEYVVSSITDIPTDKNAFYFDNWNDGSPTMGTWNYEG